MPDYKKSGKEPIAWITRGGKHIPIFNKDEQGRVKVFHGTGSRDEFDEFDISKSGSGVGGKEKAVWFTMDYEAAKSYSEFGGNPRVIPVYLDDSNFMILDFEGGRLTGKSTLEKNMFKYAKKGGYDGIKFLNVRDAPGKNAKPTTVYAVINLKTIKK